jgi:hypothetical protein
MNDIEEAKRIESGTGSLDVPTPEAMFYTIRALLRVVHELSVRKTGGGFVIYDFLGEEGNDLHSYMSMPLKIEFTAENEGR